MSDFSSMLKLFFDGDVSLVELQKAVSGAARSPRSAQNALHAIDEAFASGRLPTQVYQMLRSALPSDENDDDGDTVQNVPATGDLTEATVQETPPPNDATELTVRPVTPEIVDAKIDETRASLVEATKRPEPKKVPEAFPEPTRTEPLRAPPPHAPANRPAPPKEAPAEQAAPAAAPAAEKTLVISGPDGPPSKLTGSNWSHPEKWRQRADGPIGIGSVVKDRFVIESQLGQGGMGIVFKARDQRKIEAKDRDPYVAIKILNEGFRKHPRSLIALQREATKAQTLAHPNIITVYDFDRDGTNVYMTMELMRGKSLAEHINSFRKGGDSPEEAYPIIMGMAAGLAYAHKRSIVHADFKPGNVFLTEDERVKILDFGIARAVQIGGVDAAPADEFDAGELNAMTPGYASLEMLRGEPPAPSCDVYALGVTAYTLLTGQHPYDRKMATEAFADKMRPRPIKGLGRRRWKTLAKALELRREDRFADAEQFVRRFRGPSKFAKAATVAIAVLALSASFFAWQSLQEPGPAFPFESLTVAEQQQFQHYIEVGSSELEEPPSIYWAFDAFDSAYNLHPRNPEAVSGLNEVADLILTAAKKVTTPEEKWSLLRDLNERFLRNEYLNEHDELLDLKAQLADDLLR